MRLQTSGVEVTMVDESERENKEAAHMTEPEVAERTTIWQVRASSAKKLFHILFHHPPHYPPLPPFRALALPFIKSRPLVPKKFENPKKSHIAPSQRLVAKVHPSQTSLSKGSLFFVFKRNRCAYTLFAFAQRLSDTLCLYTYVYTPPAAAKVARRAEPPVAYPKQQLQDKRLPYLISLLRISHRPSFFAFSLVSCWTTYTLRR
jgi:hypothetical protein